MATSPFKRRPTSSKTYSKRSSLTSTSRTRPPTDVDNSRSDIAKLLMDSSDEGESDNSDQDVQLRLVGSKNSEGKDSQAVKGRATGTNGATASTKGKEKQKEPVQEGNKQESTRGSSRKGVSKKGEEEDSTNWDEVAVMAKTTRSKVTTSSGSRQSGNRSIEGPVTKSSRNSLESTQSSKSIDPSPPKRQRSLRNSNTSTSNAQPDSPSASAPKPPSSPPPAIEDQEAFSDPPSPPSRKRRKKSAVQSEAITEDSISSVRNRKVGETDDEIPPPFDYVAPLPRLRSSPEKPLPSSNITSINAAARPSPVASTSAPIIRTILPSSSSPPKPSPLPSTRPRSSLETSTSETQQPLSSAIAVKPKRPASPAKDLSSLFSSFANSASDSRSSATPMLDVSDAESSSSSRLGLKRSASGGVVAAMASKRASERGDGRSISRAASPMSPARPTRTPLDRSASQPTLSSPHSSPNSKSPFHSPRRNALGATSSLPDAISPQRAQNASPSPLKNTQDSSDLFVRPPAIGSAYRPVSFSATSSTLADNGRNRTYGGARSIRVESDNHALLSREAENKISETSTASETGGFIANSPQLPSLPPSIQQRIPRPTAARETYAQLKDKWGVSAEQELDEDEEQESQDRGARVVGTGILRAQGEGKRWSDEMGWTLDGLRDGKGGSGAKSSALELLAKTLDRDWLRRLKSSGMSEQVYLAFRRGGAGDGDRVLDVALIVLLAALTRDQRLCEPLFRLASSDIAPSAAVASQSTSDSQSSSPRKGAMGSTERDCDLLQTLVGMAEREWATEEIGTASSEANDRTFAKKGKLSKSDARHLQALRGIIDQSDFFNGAHLPVTLRTLNLEILRTIASFTARPIFQPQQLLCTSGAFETAVEAFLDESRPLGQRVEKYANGLDILPPTTSTTSGESISLTTISLCLAVFEATSLSTPYAFHIISSPSHLTSLSRTFTNVALTSSILAFGSTAPHDQAESGSKVLLDVLGIVFGLSTESEWSDAFLNDRSTTNDGLLGILVRIALQCRRSSKKGKDKTRSRQIRREEAETGEEEGRHSEWDTLCLVLGIITNLVESSDEAKDILRETMIDPTCQQGRKCVRTCTCPSPQPILTTLAQLYLDPLSDAPNTVYQTSITGFLRLLLGLSLVDNPRNESLILDLLSTAPPASTTAIIDALEEFAKLHEDQKEVRGMLEYGGGEEEEEEMTQVGEEEVEEVRRGKEVGDVAKRIKLTVVRLKRRTNNAS